MSSNVWLQEEEKRLPWAKSGQRVAALGAGGFGVGDQIKTGRIKVRQRPEEDDFVTDELEELGPNEHQPEYDEMAKDVFTHDGEKTELDKFEEAEFQQKYGDEVNFDPSVDWDEPPEAEPEPEDDDPVVEEEKQTVQAANDTIDEAKKQLEYKWGDYRPWTAAGNALSRLGNRMAAIETGDQRILRTPDPVNIPTIEQVDRQKEALRKAKHQEEMDMARFQLQLQKLQSSDGGFDIDTSKKKIEMRGKGTKLIRDYFKDSDPANENALAKNSVIKVRDILNKKNVTFPELGIGIMYLTRMAAGSRPSDFDLGMINTPVVQTVIAKIKNFLYKKGHAIIDNKIPQVYLRPLRTLFNTLVKTKANTIRGGMKGFINGKELNQGTADYLKGQIEQFQVQVEKELQFIKSVLPKDISEKIKNGTITESERTLVDKVKELQMQSKVLQSNYKAANEMSKKGSINGKKEIVFNNVAMFKGLADAQRKRDSQGPQAASDKGDADQLMGYLNEINFVLETAKKEQGLDQG